MTLEASLLVDYKLNISNTHRVTTICIADRRNPLIKMIPSIAFSWSHGQIVIYPDVYEMTAEYD